MPKRPSKQTQETKTTSEATKKQTAFMSILQEIKDFCKNDRVRVVVGIIISGFAIYALVSFISYFVHGAQDYSLLQSELSHSELREVILNRGGVLGAKMQDFFIDRAFGIASLSLLVMLSIYAYFLMRYRRLRTWEPFFHCMFWLFWISITAAFVQDMFHLPLFFRLGGAHGEAVNNLLVSSIQWIGTLIILFVTLITYFIAINPNTLPTLERWGKAFAALFKKKEKSQDSEDTADKEQGEDDIIELNDNEDGTIDFPDLTDSAQNTDMKGESEEITFTIEGMEEHKSEDDIEQVKETAPDDTNNLPPATIATEEIDKQGESGLTITKPIIDDIIDDNDPDAWLRKLGPYDPRADLENYHFPSLDLLKVYDNENAPIIDQDEQRANANRIVTTLRNYGVEIDSIKATVGPTVTLYEVVPKAGVRISKIQSLESDIMLSLSAVGIRIIAPMPGKGTVGIEVPNEKPQTVSMHSVVASKRFQEEKKMRLPIALGRTITNEIFMFDLAKTPHLLVAGATGQGKSVAINTIITSLLYKKHPAELKMVLVDPKMVEFAPYKPLLRHYLASQPDVEPNDIIITDCSKVIDTLNSLVIEMENRYKLLMDAGVRTLEDYNDKFINRRLNPAKLVADSLHHRYLPYIVIVIDEYGDFIMQAGKQVEQPIARITQKARAVGMHMILATQRPSVNIVTGVIKANIPTRIALRTQSVVDSRTVLDAKGADQLIGRGDLLYSGSGNITRVQCAFVDTPEVDAIVEHIEQQQHYSGPYELPEYVSGENEGEALAPGSVDLKRLDPMFRDVATYVVNKQEGSTSKLQRAFEIGYNRAGKLTDQLEAAGIVGPNKGSKGRDVLIQDEATLKEVFQRLEI